MRSEDKSFLGDIDILSGFPFASENFTGDIATPLIRIRDLLSGEIQTYYRGAFDKAYLVKQGDILVGMDGDFSVVRWKGVPALLNQRICKISSTSNDLDNQFLYWWLKPHIEEIHRKTPQTTVRHLSTHDIYRISAPKISKDEQAAAAWILDTIDAAIEKSEALIAKLKQVRAGMLHDLLTCGVDENGEIRDSTREPNKFKNSHLGQIPTSWSVQPLSFYVASLDAGVSVNSDDRPHGSGEIGVLKTSALTDGKFHPNKNKTVIAAERCLVKEPVLGNSILVSRMNTPQLVGESCYVEAEWPTLFLPDRIWQLKIHSQDAIHIRWLSYVLKTPYFRRYVEVHATGTSGSMKNLPKEKLLCMPVAFPEYAEQEEISHRIKAVDVQIDVEEAGLEKLRKLKAGLFADLLTGQVRVPPDLELP